MPKLTNDYTEDDFWIYFEDQYRQADEILVAMREAISKIVRTRDPDAGFTKIDLGAREVLKILRATHRDVFFHFQGPVFAKEKATLAVRVARHRRRLVKNATQQG